jgi:hypothetical protein
MHDDLLALNAAAFTYLRQPLRPEQSEPSEDIPDDE